MALADEKIYSIEDIYDLPGSQRMDYMIKLFKYRTSGVREYWIVDPKDETVAVYDFEHDDMGKLNEQIYFFVPGQLAPAFVLK